MRRFAGRSNRGGRPLRPMDWGGAFLASSSTLAGNSTNSGWALSPDQVARNYTDPTLMRSLHSCSFIVTSSPNATTDPLGDGGSASAVAFGIIKWQGVPSPNVSEDVASPIGVALGPSQVPRPMSDANLDWIWRWVVPVPLTTTANSQYFNGQGPDLAGESKAKRRLGNDSGILYVVQNATNVPIHFSWAARLLIKE